MEITDIKDLYVLAAAVRGSLAGNERSMEVYAEQNDEEMVLICSLERDRLTALLTRILKAQDNYYGM
jgi:hypothetical protein